MDKKQIIDRIVEMLCEYPIEYQEEIIKDAVKAIHENWEETVSSGWDDYSFGV